MKTEDIGKQIKKAIKEGKIKPVPIAEYEKRLREQYPEAKPEAIAGATFWAICYGIAI
jgi:hypothetical protein